MGESTILALAKKLKKGEDLKDIKGICYMSSYPRDGYLILPSYKEVAEDKKNLFLCFILFTGIMTL